MELNKEILDAVTKSLPGIHAQALGEYFKAAEANEVLLENLKNDLSRSGDSLDICRKQIQELLTKVKKDEELTIREAAIRSKEVEFEILKQRVELEKEKTATVKEMFGQVFRNLETRNTIFSPATPVYVPGYNGNSGYVDRCGNANNPGATNKTEEVSKSE